MSENSVKYLQPHVVSRLRNLNLIAKLVVEGFMTGLHKSPYHGFSVEFAEHRQYMPGDDIRHMDWKVYAKTDRFVVKQYEEETNLKSYLLVDASASMAYSSHGISKMDYAIHLSSALAYLMLKQRDAVGLLTFDEHIRRFLPPRSVQSFLHEILSELQRTKPASKTLIGKAFHELADRINRRGLIIIFSDLLEDPDEILRGLKHFRHNQHQVIVFHILDPFERYFDFKRSAVFKDMETGEKLPTQPWTIRGDYRRLVAEYVEKIKKQCHEQRIDYVLMDTSEPYDRALLHYLIKRKRIGG